MTMSLREQIRSFIWGLSGYYRLLSLYGDCRACNREDRVKTHTRLDELEARAACESAYLNYIGLLVTMCDMCEVFDLDSLNRLKEDMYEGHMVSSLPNRIEVLERVTMGRADISDGRICTFDDKGKITSIVSGAEFLSESRAAQTCSSCSHFEPTWGRCAKAPGSPEKKANIPNVCTGFKKKETAT